MNLVMGDKLMRENAALAKQFVSVNSTFITNAARNKSAHTLSAVRQVTTPPSKLSAPSYVPMISMIHNSMVAHETIDNESPGDSSTSTADCMVGYVQAMHLDPFNVSLGTNYNRTLL
jgi:hypothetical protein